MHLCRYSVETTTTQTNSKATFIHDRWSKSTVTNIDQQMINPSSLARETKYTIRKFRCPTLVSKSYDNSDILIREVLNHYESLIFVMKCALCPPQLQIGLELGATSGHFARQSPSDYAYLIYLKNLCTLCYIWVDPSKV